MRKNIYIACLFTFFVIVPCVAMAQTPDGLTPNMESVCDAESGAAYGLCNAYCEAMDCESDTPQASETACTKVASKFNNITGRGLPCELECPCIEVSSNFADFLNNVQPDMYCWDNELMVIISLTETIIDAPYIGAMATEGYASCGYLDLATGTSEIYPISYEQGQYCKEILRNASAGAGLTCSTEFPN